MEEIWKQIISYPDYFISNLGNVKSLKHGKIKYLKKGINGAGYFLVVLHKKGKRKSFNVHQLVAMAFLSHTPNGSKVVVDHKDANKQNNLLSNLQLITNRQNISKDKKGKSSQFTGVSWAKTKKKWNAQINVGGKVCNLGYYKNEIEASIVYQNKLADL